MKPTDIIKAIGVAVFTLIVTLAASYPMVAFYAYFVEPGHPQQFYVDAAQWIAPWSSHVLGPLVLFGCNFLLAKRTPERNALFFAAITVLCYAIIDFGTLPVMGINIRVVLTLSVAFWLTVKLAGAIAGAYLGSRIRIKNEGVGA